MTDDWHFSRFNTILLSKRRLTIFSMTYPSRQIQIQTLFVKLVNLSNNISAFLQPNASSCLWLDYWTLLLISCLTPVLVRPPLISYNRDSPSERFTDLASPYKISSWSWSYISEQRKFAMFTILSASYLLRLGVWASQLLSKYLLFLYNFDTLWLSEPPTPGSDFSWCTLSMQILPVVSFI